MATGAPWLSRRTTARSTRPRSSWCVFLWPAGPSRLVDPPTSFPFLLRQASVLSYAQGIAKAANDGRDITGVLLLVPAWFSQHQRRALADAAALADMNLLGIASTHSGAALQFGIERQWETGKKTRVVLFDLGANSLEAAVVEYSAYNVTEWGRAKTVGQFQVLETAFDPTLGTEAVEAVLADHLAIEFNDKNPKKDVDVRSLARPMAKLLKQAKRVKEVLSANNEAQVSVEEVHGDRDLRTTVSRQQLESLLDARLQFSDRVRAVLRGLLERSGLQPADVDFFELLGGGSRIPLVQRALQEELGGRALDRHLDADEAAVLGGGLMAANISTAFKLRPFGMVDGSPYPMVLVRSDLPEGDPAARLVVVPRMRRTASSRKVTMRMPAEREGQDTLSFSLQYDDAEPLPPWADGPLLGEYELSGLAAVQKRYNSTGRITVHLQYQLGGALSVSSAECLVELTEMVEVEERIPVNETEAATDPAAGAEAAASAAGGGDAAAGSEVPTEEASTAEDEAPPEEAGEGATAAAAASNATANATTVTYKVRASFQPVKSPPLAQGHPIPVGAGHQGPQAPQVRLQGAAGHQGPASHPPDVPRAPQGRPGQPRPPGGAGAADAGGRRRQEQPGGLCDRRPRGPRVGRGPAGRLDGQGARRPGQAAAGGRGVAVWGWGACQGRRLPQAAGQGAGRVRQGVAPGLRGEAAPRGGRPGPGQPGRPQGQGGGLEGEQALDRCQGDRGRPQGGCVRRDLAGQAGEGPVQEEADG